VGNIEADQALVERVKRGDKAAFDLLVIKYQSRIINLVMRFVRNQADALDVTQEAFIKAYRAIPNFRGDSAFYTWLYRIAVNTAKNYLAVQANRRLPEVDQNLSEMEQIDGLGDKLVAQPQYSCFIIFFFNGLDCKLIIIS